jgi:hypothetical protein
VNRSNVGYVLLVACLFSLFSPRLCSAASATGPFASTCLTGRYVTTGSGLDITFLNPFAVVGTLNFTCGKNGTGAYTGSTIVTYPVDCTGNRGIGRRDALQGALNARKRGRRGGWRDSQHDEHDRQAISPFLDAIHVVPEKLGCSLPFINLSPLPPDASALRSSPRSPHAWRRASHRS